MSSKKTQNWEDFFGWDKQCQYRRAPQNYGNSGNHAILAIPVTFGLGPRYSVYPIVSGP